jgi:hypothetical protein
MGARRIRIERVRSACCIVVEVVLFPSGLFGFWILAVCTSERSFLDFSCFNRRRADLPLQAYWTSSRRIGGSFVAALRRTDAAAERAEGGKARLHQPWHARHDHQRTRAEQQEAEKVDAQRGPPRAVEDGLGALVAH